ncbi:MAG: Ig-like domain-containing protein [Lachnospiraceae bacterium]|nr:Ig-like domain-containing protein [Lachnospiraceae bacterium]
MRFKKVRITALFTAALLLATMIPVQAVELDAQVAEPEVLEAESELQGSEMIPDIIEEEFFETEEEVTPASEENVPDLLPATDDEFAPDMAGYNGIEFIEVPEGYYNDELIEDSGEDYFDDDDQLFASTDAYWDRYSNYFFYNQMTDTEKKYYDSLNDACLKVIQGNTDYKQVAATSSDGSHSWYLLPTASAKGLSSDQLQDIFFIFYYNNPQYYFVYNSVRWSGTTVYMMCDQAFHLGADRAATTSAMRDQLDSWMSEVNTETTQLGKEKKAHDIIARDVQYVSGQFDQSSYSAVVQHKTVCTGYAKTMDMLLSAAGIDAGVVNKNGVHAWNIVRVNGTWYYVDVTWDDQTWGTMYKYFNRSSSVMSDSDHQADSMWGRFLPSLTADSGGSADGTAAALGTTSAPKASQAKSGSSYSISLSSDSGSKIWYTLDKTDPGSAVSKSTLYSGSITAKKGAVIKARAERTGYYDSGVVTVTAGDESIPDPDPDDPPEDEDKVKSISLDQKSIVLKLGESATLTSTITPSTAYNTLVDWTTSEDSKAYSERVIRDVSSRSGTNNPVSTCTFTANKVGTVTVTVTTREGGYSASCKVTVTDGSDPVPGDVQTYKILVGQNITTYNEGDPAFDDQFAAAFGEDARKRTIKYRVDPSGLLSMSTKKMNGIKTQFFTGKKPGTATIYVTRKWKDYENERILANIIVTKPEIDKANQKITVNNLNDTYEMTDIVNWVDGIAPDSYNVAWKSANDSVANVDTTGHVTFGKAGTAKVTGTFTLGTGKVVVTTTFKVVVPALSKTCVTMKAGGSAKITLKNVKEGSWVEWKTSSMLDCISSGKKNETLTIKTTSQSGTCICYCSVNGMTFYFVVGVADSARNVSVPLAGETIMITCDSKATAEFLDQIVQYRVKNGLPVITNIGTLGRGANTRVVELPFSTESYTRPDGSDSKTAYSADVVYQGEYFGAMGGKAMFNEYMKYPGFQNAILRTDISMMGVQFIQTTQKYPFWVYVNGKSVKKNINRFMVITFG